MSVANDIKSWYRAVTEDSGCSLPLRSALDSESNRTLQHNMSNSPSTRSPASTGTRQADSGGRLGSVDEGILPSVSSESHTRLYDDDLQDVEGKLMPERSLRRTHGSRKLRQSVSRSSASSTSLSSNNDASVGRSSETPIKLANGSIQLQASLWKRQQYPRNNLSCDYDSDSLTDHAPRTEVKRGQETVEPLVIAPATVTATQSILRVAADHPQVDELPRSGSDYLDRQSDESERPKSSTLDGETDDIKSSITRTCDQSIAISKAHAQRRRGTYPLQDPASIADLRQPPTSPASPPRHNASSGGGEVEAVNTSRPTTQDRTQDALTPHRCNPIPRRGYPLQSPVSIPALQHPPTPPFMVQKDIAREIFDEQLPDKFFEISKTKSFTRRNYPLQDAVEPSTGPQAASWPISEKSEINELGSPGATTEIELNVSKPPSIQTSTLTDVQNAEAPSSSTLLRRAKYPLQFATSRPSHLLKYEVKSPLEASTSRADDERQASLPTTGGLGTEATRPTEDKKNMTSGEHAKPLRRQVYPLQSPASRDSLNASQSPQHEQAFDPRPHADVPLSSTSQAVMRPSPHRNDTHSRHPLQTALVTTVESRHETPSIVIGTYDEVHTEMEHLQKTDPATQRASQWRKIAYPQQSTRSGPGFDRAPTPCPVEQLEHEDQGPIHLPKNLRAVHDSKVDVHDRTRTIVVCLDGTGDKFDDDNSNIVHIISALKKDDPRQLTYYQAGIGTYGSGGLSTGFEAAADMAVGSGLGAHVRDAYHFLMHSYKEGDKICIFGFSRGAYTARCLAGMIHKVGLLPPRNIQQILFAYEFYKDDTALGWKHSLDFKRTFSTEVNVHFLGCFDSVASVGIIPRQLPLSTTPTNKPRHFRHAMALDERRAKFKICRHQTKGFEDVEKGGARVTTITKTTATQLLDMLPNQKPEQDVPPDYNPLKRYGTGNHPNLTDEEYRDLYGHDDRFETDVLEVWFAGCHADVGGGAVSNDQRHKLAQIPLRWMIRQAFECNTGIIFKTTVLAEYGLDVHTLWPEYKSLPIPSHSPPPSVLEKYDVNLPPRSVRRNKLIPIDRKENGENFYQLASHTDDDWTPEQIEDSYDAMQPLNDQLVQAPSWWILELLPVQYKVPVAPGEVLIRTGMNLGRWRGVDDAEPNLHWTVKHRMQHLGYKIQARTAAHTTWKTVV